MTKLHNVISVEMEHSKLGKSPNAIDYQKKNTPYTNVCLVLVCNVCSSVI